MARMSKKHPMEGSLKMKDGTFRAAQFVWDAKVGGFFVKDTKGKKKYGPYSHVTEAVADGVEFHADGGKRAQFRTTPAQAAREIIAQASDAAAPSTPI